VTRPTLYRNPNRIGWPIILLLLVVALAGVATVAHDVGVASGEAKVEEYKRATAPDPWPTGFSVERIGDKIIVRCPAEDSCTITDEGGKVVVAPFNP
jgi:hypothetical protein